MTTSTQNKPAAVDTLASIPAAKLANAERIAKAMAKEIESLTAVGKPAAERIAERITESFDPMAILVGAVKDGFSSLMAHQGKYKEIACDTAQVCYVKHCNDESGDYAPAWDNIRNTLNYWGGKIGFKLNYSSKAKTVRWVVKEASTLPDYGKRASNALKEMSKEEVAKLVNTPELKAQFDETKILRKGKAAEVKAISAATKDTSAKLTAEKKGRQTDQTRFANKQGEHLATIESLEADLVKVRAELGKAIDRYTSAEKMLSNAQLLELSKGNGKGKGQPSA